jgi:pilus assembly protein Flp/PilA
MKEILSHTRGQALVEYALVLVLIAIVVIGVLIMLGSSISDVFSAVVDALEQDPPAGSGGDCYGSLLLPYLVGLTVLLLVVFRLLPQRPHAMQV